MVGLGEKFGVCVYHDSRTKELAETMHVPRVSLEDATSGHGPSSIRAILEKTHFNLEEFNEGRVVKISQYNKMLKNIHLDQIELFE